jgi:hypothetical protein
MRQLLEIVPIIDNLVAAGPSLFGVVEDWLAGMMQAGLFVVVGLHILLAAPIVFASLLFCVHSSIISLGMKSGFVELVVRVAKKDRRVPLVGRKKHNPLDAFKYSLK